MRGGSRARVPGQRKSQPQLDLKRGGGNSGAYPTPQILSGLLARELGFHTPSQHQSLAKGHPRGM